VERSAQAIQTAFNKDDVDSLKQLMTEDHMTTVTYAGFSSAADQLKVLSDWKFSEYKIDELKVKTLAKDVALVSYQATIKGTYQGKAVSSPVQVPRSGSGETANGCKPPRHCHTAAVNQVPTACVH